jgi:hypothetical protein
MGGAGDGSREHEMSARHRTARKAWKGLDPSRTRGGLDAYPDRRKKFARP